MSGSWKITLPVSRSDAEALSADLPALADLDPPPALMTSEPDPANPQMLQLDVYVEGEPQPDLVAKLRELLPTSPQDEAIIELLPEEDWVTLSQSGLQPVRAGRFFVHTAKDRSMVPPGLIGLQVEASQAFGTGHHPTTAGCLRAIDALPQPPANALDLGTGTALLAIALAKAFPESRLIASDIDAPSIAVARENLAANGVAEGHGAGELALLVADGLDNPALAERAPYDLVVANILAEPLIAMSAGISAALAPGGTLILAGLLAEQEDAVIAAYRQTGLDLLSSDPNEGWPVLQLIRS